MDGMKIMSSIMFGAAVICVIAREIARAQGYALAKGSDELYATGELTQWKRQNQQIEHLYRFANGASTVGWYLSLCALLFALPLIIEFLEK